MNNMNNMNNNINKSNVIDKDSLNNVSVGFWIFLVVVIGCLIFLSIFIYDKYEENRKARTIKGGGTGKGTGKGTGTGTGTGTGIQSKCIKILGDNDPSGYNPYWLYGYMSNGGDPDAGHVGKLISLDCKTGTGVGTGTGADINDFSVFGNVIGGILSQYVITSGINKKRIYWLMIKDILPNTTGNVPISIDDTNNWKNKIVNNINFEKFIIKDNKSNETSFFLDKKLNNMRAIDTSIKADFFMGYTRIRWEREYTNVNESVFQRGNPPNSDGDWPSGQYDITFYK